MRMQGTGPSTPYLHHLTRSLATSVRLRNDALLRPLLASNGRISQHGIVEATEVPGGNLYEC
jgi:hypothetical protein